MGAVTFENVKTKWNCLLKKFKTLFAEEEEMKEVWNQINKLQKKKEKDRNDEERKKYNLLLSQDNSYKKDVKKLLELYKRFYVSYKDFYAEGFRNSVKHPKYLVKELQNRIHTDLDNIKLDVKRFDLKSIEYTESQRGFAMKTISEMDKAIKVYEDNFKIESKNPFKLKLKNKIFSLKEVFEKFDTFWEQYKSEISELRGKYLSENDDDSVLFSIAEKEDKNLSDKDVSELESWLKDSSDKFEALKNELFTSINNIDEFYESGVGGYKEQYEYYKKNKDKVIPGVMSLKAIKEKIKKEMYKGKFSSLELKDINQEFIKGVKKLARKVKNENFIDKDLTMLIYNGIKGIDDKK